MFTGTREKNPQKTGNGLAAGCQLFYRNNYGYFFAVNAMNGYLVYESGKDKSSKGKRWAPPFICCDLDAVGL